MLQLEYRYVFFTDSSLWLCCRVFLAGPKGFSLSLPKKSRCTWTQFRSARSLVGSCQSCADSRGNTCNDNSTVTKLRCPAKAKWLGLSVHPCWSHHGYWSGALPVLSFLNCSDSSYLIYNKKFDPLTHVRAGTNAASSYDNKTLGIQLSLMWKV